MKVLLIVLSILFFVAIVFAVIAFVAVSRFIEAVIFAAEDWRRNHFFIPHCYFDDEEDFSNPSS